MMLEKINNIIINIELFSVTQKADDELSSLDKININLKEIEQTLKKQIKDLNFFKENVKIISVENFNLGNVNQYFEILEGRWNEKKISKSISTDNFFNKLKNELKIVDDQISMKCDEEWRTFNKTLYNNKSYHDLKLECIETENNIKILSDFKIEFDNFKKYSDYKLLPENNIHLIDKIKKISETLNLLLNKIDVIDDEEIKSFINATSSSNGANLDLLTPNVLKWLKEKGIDNLFKVNKKNE